MSFFASGPEPEEPAETDNPRRPWMDEPEDQLPGLASVVRVLATTDHVAVALIGARVYADGLALLIEKRLRRAGVTRREWNDLTQAFMHHFADPEDRVQFGVQLSDGTRAATSDPLDITDTAPDGPLLLYRGGGGGGGNSFHTGHDRLWLWPLPPPGELQLVMKWPAFGIEETRAAVDAGQLLAAASQSAPLWPSV